jgi:membrane protein
MKKFFNLLKRFIDVHIKAAFNLANHDGVEHAGYMAFITLLSFFPFLTFLMAVTSFIGKSDHGREFIYLLISNMPTNSIQAIKPRIDEIMLVPPSSLLTISILGMIWTSSSTVEGLRTILNRIYNVASPPAYIWRRLLSILQFLIITAILLISMFILLFLPVIYQELQHFKHLSLVLDLFSQINTEMLTPILDNARHFAFMTTLFAIVMLLYYGIPNISVRMRSLIPGSILVVLLWTLSGSLLSQYIYIFSQLNVVYGSLAGFIITLLFFYIINLIFIYGAEVNKLFSDKKSIN